MHRILRWVVVHEPRMSTDTAPSRTEETTWRTLDFGPLDAVATWTTARASWLWAVALATLFADAALTVYGIGLGLTEVNPVAASLIADAGVVPTLALLKGGAVGVGVAGWVVMPDDYRGLVPAGLALPWAVATVLNCVAIGLAL
jgi:hypothetical protein